jgi:hypothetical protein
MSFLFRQYKVSGVPLNRMETGPCQKLNPLADCLSSSYSIRIITPLFTFPGLTLPSSTLTLERRL